MAVHRQIRAAAGRRRSGNRMTDVNEAWAAHRRMLMEFVVKRVGNPMLADDIVHDVLIKAYERMSALRQPTKLQAWLYQMTRHAIVDHYRKKRMEPLPDDIVDDENSQPRFERELSACLSPLMSDMEEPYRSALQAADIEGVGQKEIAERSGLSLSGAKSRLQRARRMLRDRLLECCRAEVNRQGSLVEYEQQKKCGCSDREEKCCG